MRKLFVLVMLAVGSMWGASHAVAQHWQQHQLAFNNGASFQAHWNIASQFPQQISALVQWRMHNPHVDLRLHPQIIVQNNWHPSVVAVVHHPQFINRFNNNPPWRNGFFGFGRQRNVWITPQVIPQTNHPLQHGFALQPRVIVRQR